ncbi:hypothetical protein BB559_005535 [Furculomyces boomerangus]|uniref:Proteasome subunit beta n=2 Tax=Harpellales TaxID=61421 RepID=A0A2T9XY95_9FUNG|nr:hypothetical protein BB559_007225 [Furculomyces boomerangus]PVU88538.1 hypothetical protein BB559_005535 [Furculomyces boomerangus]PWA01162.1 hypothetical protein BB558_002739 [Smittium angustum]
MDIQLGLAGKDFVILLADNQITNSILTIKHDEDKIYKLSEHVVMSVSGEPGDSSNFSEYILGNTVLYNIRNQHELSVDSCAKFTRKELANALRSRSPYQVNYLIGGYNTISQKPALYRIDYLASIAKVEFAAHGYASYFCYSIFDRMKKPDLTQDEALDILAACVNELTRRLVINHSSYTLKLVDSNGVRVINGEELLKRTSAK